MATPACLDRPTTRRASSTRLRLAMVALATGGFTIGTTEFVTMGLLPEIADGVSVSISHAGHVISAYAVGVVVGAPLLAFLGARMPRKGLLLAFMAAYGAANAASAVAGSFGVLTVARFAAGLPHGAYLGVAALVAAGLADAGRQGRAVAQVMLGLSVAQVAGVPLATWLGQHAGWRAAFWVVTGFAVLTLVLVLALVPRMPAEPEASAGREATALTRSQVWLTLLAGAVGFGGMFAVYTYISPAVTQAGGLPSSAVPVFLAAFGLGSVIGTVVAGDLADWSMFRSLLGSALGMGLSLLLFAVVIPSGWWAIALAFAIPVLGSVLVVNLQMRLMHVAGPAKTLGAALNHSSLNVANALGAWLGGVVIAAGFGYRSPAVIGALLSLGGLAVLTASLALHRRHVARRSGAVSGGTARASGDGAPQPPRRAPLPRS